MANTRKVYTIEIQLDAARQALADANKKLTELDQQLTGLDQNSDAAKAIRAEMAKVAKEVEGLTDEVGDLGSSLDNLKPGTIGALKAEVEQLERAFEATVIGTKEQEEALLALGKKKGELKQLEDAVDALDPKMKAAAFVDFANGVVGAVAVATASMEAFGLSSDAAEEAQKKLLSLIAVMDGVEQVSKALNSETLAVVKSTLASAKGWLTAGEAATTSGKLTRAALISTGLGAFIVLLGLLVAHWDDFKKSIQGSEQFFTKVKATAEGFFDGVLAGLKNIAGVAEALWDRDFSGALAKAKKIGSEMGQAYSKGYQESIVDSALEAERAMVKLQVESRTREINERKARGEDTFKLEEKNLMERLRIQKQGTDEEKKEYLDLYSDLRTLRIAHNKAVNDEEYAALMQRLSNRISIEETKGNDVLKMRVDQSKKELAHLLAAADQDKAAIAAKRGEIANLELQITQRAAEKRRADLLAEQAQELALLQLQGKDTLDMRIAQAEAVLQLDTDTSERGRQQREADQRAYELLLAERQKADDDARQARMEGYREEQGANAALLASVKPAITSAANAVRDEQAALMKRLQGNLGAQILMSMFGVDAKNVEAVQAQITQVFQQISATVSEAVNAYFSEATAAADAELERAQAAYDAQSQKLDEARTKREQTEEALKTATGARRDYLLKKLQAERAEEERLAAAKARAAREEEKAAQRKAKLEREQQIITAASTAAAATYNAVLAVQAALEAVKQGSKVPFPVNIAAIAAGVIAVGAAVLSARSLAKSLGDGGTLGNGGEIVGGSHASGNDVPVLGGRYRVEGGEMITPVDATQRNRGALELIRTQGRKRTLLPADFARAAGFSVLPAPTSSGLFTDGGVIPGGSGGSSSTSPTADASLAGLAALEQQLRETNALLAQVAAYTLATAARPDPVLAFGPEQAVAAEQQLQVARQSAAPVRLG